MHDYFSIQITIPNKTLDQNNYPKFARYVTTWQHFLDARENLMQKKSLLMPVIYMINIFRRD